MKRLLFLLLGLLSTTGLMAQEVMTPELLWDLGRVGGGALSPDGKYLVYGVTRYDIDENGGSSDLYMADIESGDNRRLTSLEGSEYGAQWHPSGEKVGFLHGGQWYEIPAEGGEPVQITEYAYSIGNVKYSPNGDKLLFTAEVKITLETSDRYPDYPQANALIYDNLMYRHWDHWSDGRFSHVHYVELEDGKPKGSPVDIMEGEPYDSPLAPFGGSEALTWGPDGQSIIYACKKLSGVEYARSTNGDLYRYDFTNFTTTNLTDFNEGYDNNPQYSPDGKYMAWLSMERDGYESDQNRLMLMEVSSGKYISLMGDRPITVGGFSWGRDSRTIYAELPTKATQQIFSFDLPKKFSDMPEDVEVKQHTSGNFNYGVPMDAGDHWVVGRTDMNHAREYYSVNKKSKEVANLTRVNESIYNQISLSAIEKRMIKTSDGKEMLTWVVFPPNFDPDKKYPTLLYCQGGPQAAVSQFYSFRWNFQLMAAQGFIVVAPNRRGLPGFGLEWNEDISQDWGGQAMRDYLSAIDTVAEEPYVNKDKLGAVGASYGGYSVYYLAGIHEKRFKTFISHCGLFNLESWYGSTEELFFADWDIGGPYWETPRPESYDKFSPHLNADKWDTPILVIHGGKDFRVPYTQGLEAYQAAQVQGIPSRLLFFPEEGHWVLSPQNGLIWHSEFFGWLNRWLVPSKE
ncbi:S9 family peptidase [Cryomorphaceae bacterium]|nr:S9 family peptidase [Cryomorphaceae bacterium]